MELNPLERVYQQKKLIYVQGLTKGVVSNNKKMH